MRRTALVSALAAATLVAGAGAAHADERDAGPEIDPDANPCIFITTYTNVVRAMCLYPSVAADGVGGFGYGSFGTGSLADLLTGFVNAGSVVLSVDVPNSTGPRPRWGRPSPARSGTRAAASDTSSQTLTPAVRGPRRCLREGQRTTMPSESA